MMVCGPMTVWGFVCRAGFGLCSSGSRFGLVYVWVDGEQPLGLLWREFTVFGNVALGTYKHPYKHFMQKPGYQPAKTRIQIHTPA